MYRGLWTGASILNLKFLANRRSLTGLFFLVVGILGFWLARDLPIGTARNMSAGYFPRIVCTILVGLGAVLWYRGFRYSADQPDSGPARRWQASIFVSLSIVAFGLAIELLGLIISAALVVSIGSMASHKMSVREVTITGVFLILLVYAIFVGILGLAIPVWPEF